MAKKWDLKKIAEGFKKFYAEHNRYPTTHEVDSYKYLPSSRQIQRRFGGLVELRQKLKLSGPVDFTKGEYSSERARKIGKRAHQGEKLVYEYLVKRFGRPFVHREHFFLDDKRTRTDFLIYCKNGNFCVDVFHPKDRFNLTGCLNSKMRVYGDAVMLQYPVIFLIMNENISQKDIDDTLARKKNKLNKQERVMTMGQLKEFCRSKTPLSISRM